MTESVMHWESVSAWKIKSLLDSSMKRENANERKSVKLMIKSTSVMMAIGQRSKPKLSLCRRSNMSYAWTPLVRTVSLLQNKSGMLWTLFVSTVTNGSVLRQKIWLQISIASLTIWMPSESTRRQTTPWTSLSSISVPKKPSRSGKVKARRWKKLLEL